MKPLFFLLLAITSVSSITADEKPFTLFLDYNKVSPAKVHHPHKHHHEKFGFAEGRALALYTHRFSEWGIRLGVGAMKTDMQWKGHHPFTKRHFTNALFSLGAYTTAIEKWVWDLNMSLQVNTQQFSSRYTFTRALLHGRYAWTKKAGLHVGLLGTAGMRYTTVLPVIGIDYKRSKWQYNLVFPINISAFYSFTDNWSAGAALRSFSSRQRMLKEDHLSRGLVLYRDVGLELGVVYQLGDTITANVHVGETLGGRVRVSNQHNRDRKHYKLRPSPYFGLEFQLNF